MPLRLVLLSGAAFGMNVHRPVWTDERCKGRDWFGIVQGNGGVFFYLRVKKLMEQMGNKW